MNVTINGRAADAPAPRFQEHQVELTQATPQGFVEVVNVRLWLPIVSDPTTEASLATERARELLRLALSSLDA